MAARRRGDDVDPLDHLTLGRQPSNTMWYSILLYTILYYNHPTQQHNDVCHPQASGKLIRRSEVHAIIHEPFRALGFRF